MGRAGRPTPAVFGAAGQAAATSAACCWRSGAPTIAAQTKPTSSRATAVVATVERFPLAVSARWRRNRRVCACQARAVISGGTWSASRAARADWRGRCW